MKRADIAGQRFGRLVAIERIGSQNYMSIWRCKCDCGNETNVTIARLRNGTTKSCGCLVRERASEVHLKHGGAKKKKHDRLYRVWIRMKQRCYLKTSCNYHWYGERGITVCDAWHDYANFKKWAYENGYNPDAEYGACTLDRIDVNANYEPSNCRWVDFKAQARNRRKKENEQ